MEKIDVTKYGVDINDELMQSAIFSDRLEIYMVRGRNAIMASPVASTYMVFLQYGDIDNTILFGWWIVSLMVDTAVFLSTHRFIKKRPKNLSRYLQNVVFLQCMSGFVWSTTVYWFRIPDELIHELYTYVILIAIVCITTVIFMPFRFAYVSYIICISSFPLAYFLYLGGAMYLKLSLGIVIMDAVLIFFQTTATHQFVDGLTQRLKVQFLAEALDENLKKIEKYANYDELTNLFNRRFGLECLRKEKQIQLRYKSTLTITMIDIDHFKSINDTYGHPVGDLVLTEFSKLMQKQFRTEAIVMRYGGEEFLAVTPRTNLLEAEKMAERLRSELSTSSLLGEHFDIKITASIGVAEIAPDELIEHAIMRADQALYRAKRNGRNRVELSQIDKLDRQDKKKKSN